MRLSLILGYLFLAALAAVGAKSVIVAAWSAWGEAFLTGVITGLVGFFYVIVVIVVWKALHDPTLLHSESSEPTT